MKKSSSTFDLAERFLTTAEAGKLLGMHPETVKKKCAAKLIRASKPGKSYRIPESAIRELLANGAAA